MSTRVYHACHQAVSVQHTNPPNSFLDVIIDTIDGMSDTVFAVNPFHDIYSVMLGSLGPYNSILHRKAVMCEVLRVVAAFESDWDWNEGVDTNNSHSVNHKEGQETGAFQVSWDSLALDPSKSLQACVDRALNAHDVDTFIPGMKENHPLAVEYCARLLRFNTQWCGTINDSQKVIAHVRRDAVVEFQSFLTPNEQPDATPAAPKPAKGAAGKTSDKDFIPRLLSLGSSVSTLDDAQSRAGKKLMTFDGEEFPHNACAITLSTLLQDAGIPVPDIFQAINLGKHLEKKRGWQRIEVGNQMRGDIGSTCGDDPVSGQDHIYLVLERVDADQMLIADNQKPEPHPRFASGKGGKTRTKFFLRAT